MKRKAEQSALEVWTEIPWDHQSALTKLHREGESGEIATLVHIEWLAGILSGTIVGLCWGVQLSASEMPESLMVISTKQ